MMAVGAHLLVLEIDLATLRTFDDLSCDGYTTVGTKGSLVTYLSPTFGAFYHCHNM